MHQTTLFLVLIGATALNAFVATRPFPIETAPEGELTIGNLPVKPNLPIQTFPSIDIEVDESVPYDPCAVDEEVVPIEPEEELPEVVEPEVDLPLIDTMPVPIDEEDGESDAIYLPEPETEAVDNTEDEVWILPIVPDIPPQFQGRPINNRPPPL